eukprot:4472671-Amphidinium_carterae.1
MSADVVLFGPKVHTIRRCVCKEALSRNTNSKSLRVSHSGSLASSSMRAHCALYGSGLTCFKLRAMLDNVELLYQL